MTTTRLEAFSDGVIAILITIMVLELRPEGVESWQEISQPHGLLRKLLLYVLSFVYLGIYWTNHHHMFHATKHVNGKILWANLHLLFWLSLVPLATAWMGQHNAPIPTAIYGFVLICAAQAYTILQGQIIKLQGPDSPLAAAVGRDSKGLISRVLYLVAIGAAFIAPWISDVLYASVAAMWLVPDRRIEKTLHH